MKTETMEAISSAGAKTAVVGGSVAVFGGLTAADIAAYVGATVAILGFLVTVYYKHKADKRLTREHDLRVELLRRGHKPDTDLGELGADE